MLRVVDHRAPAGKVLKSLYREETFGLIRKIVPLRARGGEKDLVVLSTDSGTVMILEFDLQSKAFIKKYQDVSLGRLAVNLAKREMSGEYMAADPKGRAVMVAASEKQ